MRCLLTEQDIDSIHRVKHCASREESRRLLNGVMVTPTIVCATDSYRMAWAPLDGVVHRPVLIPLARINDLPTAGDCILKIDMDRPTPTASFEVAGVVYQCLDSDDDMKDWGEEVLAKFPARKHRVVFDRAALIVAVGQVTPNGEAVALASGVAGIQASFYEPAGVMVITNPPPHRHGTKEFPLAPEVQFVKVPSDKGWMPTIILNRKYLLECLRALTAEKVTVSTSTPMGGVWLTAEDDQLEQVLLGFVHWKDQRWTPSQ